MCTLISVYNSDGCVGRCDAKCYNASSPKCDCICNGMNHGAGASKARDNTARYANEWIKDYKEKKALPEATAKVNGKIFQLDLF